MRRAVCFEAIRFNRHVLEWCIHNRDNHVFRVGHGWDYWNKAAIREIKLALR